MATLPPDWARCRPLLLEALALDPTDSIERIEAAVMAGECDFWPGENVAALGAVVQHEKLKDYHLWLAGGDLEEARRALPSVVAFARAKGCNRVTINGRRGFVRALGMRELHTAMAIDL